MSSVVFPDPLGPMIATISPRATEKLTPTQRVHLDLPRVVALLDRPRFDNHPACGFHRLTFDAWCRP